VQTTHFRYSAHRTNKTGAQREIEKRMYNKTVVEFRSDADIWRVVDKWAGDSGFRLKVPGDTERLYQKGVGFLVAPMMLNVKRDGQKSRLEAWISVNLFVRLFTLFLVPSEMGIESGGFRLVAPRSIARKAVNSLLEQLGESAIQ
jgi:hypothetical protein